MLKKQINLTILGGSSNYLIFIQLVPYRSFCEAQENLFIILMNVNKQLMFWNALSKHSSISST
jgi:hypothetical protein